MTNLQRHVRVHRQQTVEKKENAPVGGNHNNEGGSGLLATSLSSSSNRCVEITSKTVKCPECSYQAATITHVKRHMAHKHLERSLPCPHCSFMGATNAELKIHIARKHLELTGKNPLFLPKYLRKDYHCGVCNMQFNDFKVTKKPTVIVFLIFFIYNLFRLLILKLKEYQTHTYEHTSTSNRFRCTECPYNCKNYSKLKVNENTFVVTEKIY